jgi:hypothetical protein
MSIKVIVFFHSGNDFGGFRIALNAKKFHIDNSINFDNLENLSDKFIDIIANTPKDEWPEIMNQIKSKINFPEIGRRHGSMNFTYWKDNNDNLIVLVRTFISFLNWRWGGFAVYKGIKITKSETSEKLNNEELSTYW